MKMRGWSPEKEQNPLHHMIALVRQDRITLCCDCSRSRSWPTPAFGFWSMDLLPILIRVWVGLSFPTIGESRLMRNLVADQCDFSALCTRTTMHCTLLIMDSGLKSGRAIAPCGRHYVFCSCFASKDPRNIAPGCQEMKYNADIFPRSMCSSTASVSWYLWGGRGLQVDYIQPCYIAIVHEVKQGTQDYELELKDHKRGIQAENQKVTTCPRVASCLRMATCAMNQ